MGFDRNPRIGLPNSWMGEQKVAFVAPRRPLPKCDIGLKIFTRSLQAYIHLYLFNFLCKPTKNKAPFTSRFALGSGANTPFWAMSGTHDQIPSRLIIPQLLASYSLVEVFTHSLAWLLLHFSLR
jgi:hypothetical protein